VGADGQQQDGLFAIMFDKSEDNPQVVTGAARPSFSQVALEFVCSQMRLKRIDLEIVQCCCKR